MKWLWLVLLTLGASFASAAELTLTPEELSAIAAEVPPGEDGADGLMGPPGPQGPPGSGGSGVMHNNGVCSVDIGENSYLWACVAAGEPVPPDPDPPDPDPPPVDPPPSEQPLVTFGPINSLVVYDAGISALKQDHFRWEITFTANSLIDKVSGTPRSQTVMGLASRDESGTTEKGHLSVWIEDVESGVGHRVVVRNQDIEGGVASTRLESQTRIRVGTEYKIIVSVSDGTGIGLFVDGVLEDSHSVAFGLTQNNLPLVVGGICTRCRADGSVGPERPLDGTTYMEIWEHPLELPAPITGTATLQWVLPTEDTDSVPLAPGALLSIHIYDSNGPDGTDPIERVGTVSGDATSYVALDLREGKHCFQVTARNGGGESALSNTACKMVP